MIRTVRVELHLTAGEQDLLAQTVADYNRAFNAHSAYYQAMRHHNKLKAHHEIYEQVRGLQPHLPSALLQAARDQSSEAIKAYNQRWPGKRWSKTPQKTSQSMRLTKRASALRGQQFTYSTIGKRQQVIINLPEWFTSKYPIATFQSASVGIDKRGQAYAQLSFGVGKPPALRTKGKTVGLDRGVINPIYTSENESFSGKQVRARRRQHLHNRRQLQQKGTRAARKRLTQQSGREQRFMRDWNHKISSALAGNSGVARYVLEDLSGLGRKNQLKKMGGERYKKRANKRLGDWAHAQLLLMLHYKCEVRGIELVFVDPAWTSQTCSQCAYRSKGNRRGGKFECGKCGFKAHADFNAAVNIRDKYNSTTLAVVAGHRELPSLETDLSSEELVADALKPSSGMDSR